MMNNRGKFLGAQVCLFTTWVSIGWLFQFTECSSAWLERLLWEQNVGGPNPSTPTILI